VESGYNGNIIRWDVVRILKKEIEYCDDCPYLWEDMGAKKHFCNHPFSQVVSLSLREITSSKVEINGSMAEAYVIPKACPLPILIEEKEHVREAYADKDRRLGS